MYTCKKNVILACALMVIIGANIQAAQPKIGAGTSQQKASWVVPALGVGIVGLALTPYAWYEFQYKRKNIGKSLTQARKTLDEIATSSLDREASCLATLKFHLKEFSKDMNTYYASPSSLSEKISQDKKFDFELLKKINSEIARGFHDFCNATTINDDVRENFRRLNFLVDETFKGYHSLHGEYGIRRDHAETCISSAYSERSRLRKRMSNAYLGLGVGAGLIVGTWLLMSHKKPCGGSQIK